MRLHFEFMSVQFVKNERNQGGERRRSGKRGRHSSAVGHKGPGTGDTVQWTPGSSSTNAVIKLLLMKNRERGWERVRRKVTIPVTL